MSAGKRELEGGATPPAAFYRCLLPEQEEWVEMNSHCRKILPKFLTSPILITPSRMGQLCDKHAMLIHNASHSAHQMDHTMPYA